ncbi:sensor histidine kinase [Paenibacillus kandeliae]|uniref:sensor histidine kinase n=1 Tax=Paenibacillus kandeliae TaxID=3231269 RepID=UPI003459F1E9
MFKQLRNRFLILNLATISILMIIAFASIYTITYRDVQNDIQQEISRISESYMHPGNGQGPPGSQNNGSSNPNSTSTTEPSTSHSTSSTDGDTSTGTTTSDTSLTMNDETQRTNANTATSPSNGNMMNGTPERAVAFMIETDTAGSVINQKSQVDIETSVYTNALKEALDQGSQRGQFTLDGSDWTFIRQPLNDGYLYTFLDITARQDILTNLVYTFAAVGVVMLILLFFTSRYFANRSIQPVREAFDKQKQFIADASHELKTPLAVINTNTDVLLANPDDTIRNQSKWLHYIKGETERMARLTGDLLFLTEMEQTRTPMMYTDFDLSDTVENIILTMEAVIFEKNLTLDYDITPGLVVEGSSQQIHQVTMILLDNAIKYCNTGGDIKLTLHRQGNQAVLSVTNTGDGIAAEHLPRIFDRFYRTDTSRARKLGGHGLGLAIAKSIVEQHKGKIEATSVVGQSTTFYVYMQTQS